jgi:hypothetical protein
LKTLTTGLQQLAFSPSTRFNGSWHWRQHPLQAPFLGQGVNTEH